MTGLKITEKLAKAYSLPESLTRKIILDILQEIETIALATGRCQIRGFGTFRLKTYAPKKTFDYASRTIKEIPQITKLVFIHGRDRRSIIPQENSPDHKVIQKNCE